MLPEDSTPIEREEAAPAPGTTPDTAPAAPVEASEADTAAAQAKAWFDEDDADAAEAAPTVAKQPAPVATPAVPTEPESEPEQPVKAVIAKPTASPATEDAADQQDAQPAPPQFDFKAAVQQAITDIPTKIQVGGKDIDVSAFVADFPEAPAIMATVASRIVEQVVGPILPFFHAMQARQAHESFMDAVAAQVPDARQAAGTQEFRDWVDKQPKPLQAMARAVDVESAVFVLNQYAAAKGAAPAQPLPRKPAAVPASPAFERRKATLLGTLGGKAANRGAAGNPDPNDYKAAFEED